MALVLNIILFILLFLLLITTAVFSSIAASDVSRVTTSQIHTAFIHLVWASVISWISVALVALAVVLYFVYGGETISFTGNAVLLTLLGFIVIMLIITGILDAIAASNLHGQPNVGAAYRNAIIAAVTSLGGVGLIIIMLIVFWVSHRHGKSAVSDVDIEKARQATLAQLAATLSPAPTATVATPAVVTTPAVAAAPESPITLSAVPAATSPTAVRTTTNGSIPSPIRLNGNNGRSVQTLQDLLNKNSQLRTALAAAIK